MSINLSTTTPAAPSGARNVTFQTDGSGNVSGYVQATSELVGDGVDLTAQNANISSTTLVATPSGMYRISAYLIVTTVDGTSSTLPSLVITWSDNDNGQSQSITLTPTNTGNLQTTYQEASCVINAGTSTNIDYSTTGYLSHVAGTMKYSVHIRVEQF